MSETPPSHGTGDRQSIPSESEMEERFRTLVEYAPEAMVILDADTGRFIDANANACRLFDVDRESLLRLGPVELSPERQPDGSVSADAALAWVERTMKGRNPVFEWVHQTASGVPFPCEVRLVRLPYDGRRVLRGSIFDITERKAADAERERLTTELAQAQKLQAIGQLTGGIAHDFNNLLTVIMSSVEMIEDRADDTDRVRYFAQQAAAAAQRAAALTQRLLAFARRQPLRPQVVNVNELLGGIETLLLRTLGENITVRTVRAGDVWPCEADPAQLESVILNLAINARDAMPDGGSLVIETANATLGPGYGQGHDEVAPGDYVALIVTDNGTGMDPDVLNHVFEPFFTTKEAGRGSGLGLSTIYGFVKQSGGDVRIYSEPGEGTTVRVYLPRCTSGAVANEQNAGSAEIPRGDGHRVLVVEDESAVRALVIMELDSLGYRALGAADAAEALEVVGASGDDLSLLLTDVVLSGAINGPELVRRVHDRHPDLPVLFMSGYTENAIIQNGRLQPGVALLEKPFTRQRLAVAVHAALADPPASA